ncbi:hypothetical protein F5877DRAFT_48881 [Lentinula edodes]|nr:hypothetical protein F5877DRAFT_48881 [Lentinula edodes]
MASTSRVRLAPTSPPLRRQLTPEPQDTPSKRMRILSSSLASTSSGSFLVSKNPYTSSTPFPQMLEKAPLNLTEPDWNLIRPGVPPYDSHSQLVEENRKLSNSLEHAKDYILAYGEREETYAAQMVLQDMTLSKMNRALHAKEKKRAEKPDNEVLPNEGMGRLWTDTRILEFQQTKKASKAKEDAEREERKRRKALNKVAKETAENEWKSIKKKHDEAVQKWLAVCASLRIKGAKVKELPKKPTRMTKKDLMAHCSSNVSDGSEDSDDDESDRSN